MVRHLGGKDNRVPTARLIEEAERQSQARKGNPAASRPAAVTVSSEKDAEMHAAVLRDREKWMKQPISQALLDHMSVDSREHNERTRVKYAWLVDENPELFQ
jgi:hypothetical protein